MKRVTEWSNSTQSEILQSMTADKPMERIAKLETSRGGLRVCV